MFKLQVKSIFSSIVVFFFFFSDNIIFFNHLVFALVVVVILITVMSKMKNGCLLMFHSSFGFLVQSLLKNDPLNWVVVNDRDPLQTEFEGGGVGYRQCSLHFQYYSHSDH